MLVLCVRTMSVYTLHSYQATEAICLSGIQLSDNIIIIPTSACPCTPCHPLTCSNYADWDSAAPPRTRWPGRAHGPNRSIQYCTYQPRRPQHSGIHLSCTPCMRERHANVRMTCTHVHVKRIPTHTHTALFTHLPAYISHNIYIV